MHPRELCSRDGQPPCITIVNIRKIRQKSCRRIPVKARLERPMIAQDVDFAHPSSRRKKSRGHSRASEAGQVAFGMYREIQARRGGVLELGACVPGRSALINARRSFDLAEANGPDIWMHESLVSLHNVICRWYLSHLDSGSNSSGSDCMRTSTVTNA